MYLQNHNVEKKFNKGIVIKCYGPGLEKITEWTKAFLSKCLQLLLFTKQLESILREKCVLLWHLLSEELQISITVFSPKFYKIISAKRCFLGTEYTPHGRWQFFQQLGSHDA